MSTIEIPAEKWSGTVRKITLGATAAEGGTRTPNCYSGRRNHPTVLTL